MTSFARQARWNTSLSILGQGLTVVFITFVSRLLGRTEFGFYIWITALPGLFIVFDLYLGIALQNRLTALYTRREKEASDRLLWGFLWGMLAMALLFTTVGAIFTALLVATEANWVSRLPIWVLWAGFAHVSLSSLNVALLAAHLGYNAHRAVERNAVVSIAADVIGKLSFLGFFVTTRSLAIAIVGFSIVSVIAQVVTHVRFMRIYDVAFLAPTRRLVRESFADLWSSGDGRDWAITRVVDGLYKNSELVVGTFFVGAPTIGDFALLDRLSNALMLAANSIYVPLVPQLVSAQASDQRDRMARLSRIVIRYSIAGLIAFSVFFVVLGEFLASWWAGREIDFPLIILVLLCMRSWTRVLASLGFHLLAGHRLIRELKWATVVTGFVYLVLYVSSVPRIGVLGIAATQVVAQGLFVVFVHRTGVTQDPLSIEIAATDAKGVDATIPTALP